PCRPARRGRSGLRRDRRCPRDSGRHRQESHRPWAGVTRRLPRPPFREPTVLFRASNEDIMTDEPLDPARLLASADLDNETTADERAQVEASPALVEEREFYRDLRARLRVGEPSEATREAAIASALGVFDGEHQPVAVAAAMTAPAAEVVSLEHRRRRQYRWL